ncbi:MAG: DedA family protein [Myxococcaceae bacterium]
MFHELIRTWFEWVQIGGYVGIFVLMAMESSIIPVPSEIVMAPAAFWAAQGRMSFVGVVLAGTAGSYVGSLLSYWFASWVGHPFLLKYGKYILISPEKLQSADKIIRQHGTIGVFLARFLPVIRHLISLPAGLFQMPLARFTLATITGAGIWCWILAWFGQKVLGENPQLLDSPEQMISAIQSQMFWFLGAAICFTLLYAITIWFKTGGKPKHSQTK